MIQNTALPYVIFLLMIKFKKKSHEQHKLWRPYKYQSSKERRVRDLNIKFILYDWLENTLNNLKKLSIKVKLKIFPFTFGLFYSLQTFTAPHTYAWIDSGSTTVAAVAAVTFETRPLGFKWNYTQKESTRRRVSFISHWFHC